jgi:hypothetical protein
LLNFGQRKASPALRHEEATASTGEVLALRKEEARVRGAQFLRHGPSIMTARAYDGKSPFALVVGARVRATIEAMTKRRWLRRTLGLGLLAGAAYTVWRAIEANRVAGEPEWEPQPFPFPPQPRTTPPSPADAAERGNRAELASERTSATGVSPVAGSEREVWVAPVDGACPSTHPVKAKEASKIFHVPGGLSYDRTVPDRCYVDAAAAEADGFRAAKR